MSADRDALEWLDQSDLKDGRYGPLLRQALTPGRPDPARRVFVNRTLRLEKIRYVGFDLDWTLADYDRSRLERLTFELTIERLIDTGVFPPEIRELRFDPAFPRRGLLIDRQEGVVLRMNRHRFVGRAYHGRHLLTPGELIPLYRQEPIDPANPRFYHVDSLFELPETNLYSELVERNRQADPADRRPYAELFDEVRAAIDWVHRDGKMKQAVLDQPHRFLRRDPEMAAALDRFALRGRRLILITNSPWAYTDGVCSYLFDGLVPGLDSWRQLFDLVVVDSGKPEFFRNGRPFVELDPAGEAVGETASPSWQGVYSGGSLAGLMDLLACPGEQVLYVGDHIYGDIVTSKRKSTWRTALIVAELEEEIDELAGLRPEVERLSELRDRLSHSGANMDLIADAVTVLKRLEREGEALPEGLVREVRARHRRHRERHRGLLERVRELAGQTEKSLNPYWGSFFKQGNSKTLFTAQLERFACLYTSHVRNFAQYGSNHYFRVLNDPVKHDEGAPSQ